jgi:hypothetical protein
MSLMDYVSKETVQASVSNYRNRLCLLSWLMPSAYLAGLGASPGSDYSTHPVV